MCIPCYKIRPDETDEIEVANSRARAKTTVALEIRLRRRATPSIHFDLTAAILTAHSI